MKKYLLHIGIIIGGILFVQQVVFGAPSATILRDINPETNNTHYIGTTTPSTLRFRGIFATDLNVSGNLNLTGISASNTPLTFYNGAIAATSTNPFYVSSITASSSSATSNFLGNVSVTGNLTSGTLTVSGSVTGNLVVNGGTISLGASPNTATTTIVANSSGQLTLTAAGTNQNVVLTPSGTGYTLLNGNVGIGTTSPGALFAVHGAGLISSNLTVGGALTGTSTLNITGLTTLGNASTTQLTTTGSTYLATISGNVGIGTTNPIHFVTISKSSAASTLSTLLFNTDNTDAGSSARMGAVVGGASAGDAYLYVAVSDSTEWSMGLDNSDSDSFKISSGGVPGSSDRLTITTTGNVGIGTTSPWRTFDVNGTVGMKGLTVESGASDDALCLKASSNEVQVNSGATSCLLSSRRWKHDIKDLTVGIDEVMKLRPVSYRNNSNNALNVGLIAEEVHNVDPRLTVLDEKGIPKTVKYENLTAVLLKAIQEQQGKIESLEARIKKLERR